MRGKSSAAGPPTPRAIPARAIAAVARPNASLDAAAPRAARRASRASRADRSFAHTSLPTACGRPTRTRSAHASPHEKRGPVGKVEKLRGRAVGGEGAQGERKSHGEKARHHETELQEIGPHDGALAAERRVRDEKGRRDDEDARGLPRRRRDDDGLGRLRSGARTRRSPRGRRERPRSCARRARTSFRSTSASVVAPVARTRAARKRPSARRPRAPARSSQSAGRPFAATKRREDEGRGPADHRGGEGRPGRERAQAAVRDEERVLRARGVSCRKEADEEDGGAVEDEGGGHTSALQGLSRRERRARSPREGARRAAGRARRSRSRARDAGPAGRRSGPRRRTRTRPGRAAGTR